MQFSSFMWFSGWTRESNRYFGNFSRRYSKYHLKHTLLTALMPREHKTRHTNNERENERKEIIHDRISLLFRIHLCNFFHFQYIQADNRIHVIQWCCGSLHSRDKSGFLYTRQSLWNQRKKNEISKLSKKCLSYAVTVLKSASHGCCQLFAELREREIVVHEEKSYLCKKLSRDNF